MIFYRARKHPNYDLACYHSQQAAEKYFKARLKEAGISFQRTHDVPYLLNLILNVEPAWSPLQSHADDLNDYAVDFRYPGKTATKADAKKAIQDCRIIRLAVRTALSLSV